MTGPDIGLLALMAAGLMAFVIGLPLVLFLLFGPRGE